VNEPVRRTGFIDHAGLWASLGASLYAMPFGALLVPALSIEMAVLATVTAALLAALLVGVIAHFAARDGAGTLDMLSEPIGSAARIPVAALLQVRHLVLTAFALVIIGDSAALIGERVFDADLRPLWIVLFAAAAIPMTAGRFDRRGVRIAALVLALVLALAITGSAYMEFEIPSYLKRPSAGGWPSFGQAIDLMLIFPLLWLPVVADSARTAATPSAASRGSFLGFFVMAAWFGSLGIIYLPAVDSGDIPGFLAGMEMGLISLAMLFVLQADEVAVNARVSRPALRDLGGVARFAPIATIGLAAVVALFVRIGDIEPYALVTAAVFVPAFGMALAHLVLPARPIAVVPVMAWAGGFVLYQCIAPADIGWWQDALDWTTGGLAGPYPPGDEASRFGAAIPSFLFAFGIQLLGAAFAGIGARLDTAPTSG
jgi:purine-cytosine permease-like protein